MAGGMVREVRAGLVAILPVVISVIPIGLLFGALASQKGLSPLEIGLMSALVFAGSAQFVALEIWREPVPWMLLGATALTINLRHVMMGASLSRHLDAFSWPQRLLGQFFMTDESWALAERRATSAALTPAYYAALSVALYLNWVATSLAGAYIGALIENPAEFGFDFAFSALFIGLIVAFWRGPATGAVIAASGATAFLVHGGLGGVWHVVAGGLAGMATAALLSLRRGAVRHGA